MAVTLGHQTNTPITRTFKALVNNDWANDDVGEDGTPHGVTSLVLIDESEAGDLDEFMSYLDLDKEPMPKPGAYLVNVDSDGNCSVTEYPTEERARLAFAHATVEFLTWQEVNRNE